MLLLKHCFGQLTGYQSIILVQVRIVIVLLTSVDYRKFVLALPLHGLVGLAWIAVNGLASVVSTSDPTPELAARLRGWIFAQPFVIRDASYSAFLKRVGERTQLDFNKTMTGRSVTNWAGPLYDAVLLYSHAATAVINAGGSFVNGTLVMEAMRKTTFDGVTGTVALDKNGDRLESYEFRSVIPNTEKGGAHSSSQLLLLYNSASGEYTMSDSVPQIWPGATNETPIDLTVPKNCPFGSQLNRTENECVLCKPGLYHVSYNLIHQYLICDM